MSGYPDIRPESETEIIGVVEDIRQESLGQAAEPAFYRSDRQLVARRRTVVVHATVADPLSLQPAIRAEMAKTDPQIAANVVLVNDLMRGTLQRQELGMTLMLIFGAAALALAAVGIYGVIAYATSQRGGEVATRLALGATRANVFWLMVRQGRTLTLLGAGIGLAAAYAAGRVVTSRLYEVRADDPVILATAAVVVAAIALVATIIPAIRGALISPARVFRSQ
jgi:ABC-type antimicrobial peptide transport system permease subunit